MLFLWQNLDVKLASLMLRFVEPLRFVAFSFTVRDAELENSSTSNYRIANIPFRDLLSLLLLGLCYWNQGWVKVMWLWNTRVSTASVRISRYRAKPNTRYSTLPELPRPLGQNHHDLPSFLNHAAKTGLDPESSIFYGTRYEYIAQKTLRNYAFTLSRVGQTGDRGVDLAGYWHLPFLPEPLRVIVQCKSSKRKIPPEIIRGLEGAFSGAPSGWRGEGVLSILVSPLPATRGVRQAVARSSSPLCWFTMEPDDNEEGSGLVTQALWNKTATDMALQGVSVVVKHDLEHPERKAVALTWKENEISEQSIPQNLDTRHLEGQTPG